MKPIQICLLVSIVVLGGWTCRYRIGGENKEDVALAKVFNKTLYLSEMDGMIPQGASSEDSVLIINGYVERWIRETLLLHEAERNIPSDLNIDKLVRDYRASLIRNNYEQILMEEMLDSTITQAELTEFYENNKQQYQLETPIIRCYFIKVPLPVPEEDQLQHNWNSRKPEDFAKLVAYSNQYASAHMLADSAWTKVEELANELPAGTLNSSNLNSRREFIQKDDRFQYYFRLLEMKNRQEIAPLAYIEDQARKVILRKRKIQLLEQIKEDMYNREMRRDNIKTFNQ